MVSRRGILKPAPKHSVPCKSMKHHHFIHNLALQAGKARFCHVGLSNPKSSDVCEHCGWLRCEILAYEQTKQSSAEAV